MFILILYYGISHIYPVFSDQRLLATMSLDPYYSAHHVLPQSSLPGTNQIPQTTFTYIERQAMFES